MIEMGLTYHCILISIGSLEVTTPPTKLKSAGLFGSEDEEDDMFFTPATKSIPKVTPNKIATHTKTMTQDQKDALRFVSG